MEIIKNKCLYLIMNDYAIEKLVELKIKAHFEKDRKKERVLDICIQVLKEIEKNK